MEFIFLGTGAGKPSLNRNVSSLALNLLPQRSAVWLFDCGEATQHQFMRSTIKAHKIEKIFITHLHGDHVLGLPGLLTSLSMSKDVLPITVYGPVGIKLFLETVFKLTHSHITIPLEIVEIQAGQVYEDALFTVYAKELNHRIQCFGFRVEQTPKAGALDMASLQKLGHIAGKDLGRLKKGESIQLSDGRVIHGVDYIGAPTARKILTVLGDTAPTPQAQELAQDADMLIHEATFEANLIQKAQQRGHSTTKQAAIVARDSGVKRLILNHISARYGVEDEDFLLKESRAIFPYTEIAHDLQIFSV